MDGPDSGPFPNACGRCPIVTLLGDFLQLPPTNNISVVEDSLAKDEATGQYVRKETPSLEVQYGCKLFKAVPHVFELQGTKRFVKGDPPGRCLDVHAAPRCHRAEVSAAHLGSFPADLRGGQ